MFLFSGIVAVRKNSGGLIKCLLALKFLDADLIHLSKLEVSRLIGLMSNCSNCHFLHKTTQGNITKEVSFAWSD